MLIPAKVSSDVYPIYVIGRIYRHKFLTMHNLFELYVPLGSEDVKYQEFTGVRHRFVPIVEGSLGLLHWIQSGILQCYL